jgi:hypothetical protein
MLGMLAVVLRRAIGRVVHGGGLGIAVPVCLFAASGVWAGEYVPASPLYSGPGQVTLVPPIPPSPFPYAVGQDGYGGAYGGGGQVTCSGQIAATFVWVPDGIGDTPPANVIVKETCTATWSGYNIGIPPTGSCDNGLGFAAVDQGPIPGIPTPPFTTRWYSSSGTRYRVVAGAATLVITCTPAATATSAIFASAVVRYTADVYPVLVYPSGTNLRGDMYHPSILIGAGATAALHTGPLTQTAWAWSVSGGDAFSAYYTVPADSSTPTSSVREPLAPTDSDTLHFYFGKWEGGRDGTVSCQAHVAMPAGTHPSGGLDVFGQVPILIDKPSSTASVYMGTVQIAFIPNTQQRALMLWGATDGTLTSGTIWHATVTTPAEEYGDEGNPGGWNYTQLWTPHRTWGPPDTGLSFNDQDGLDNYFGYKPEWTALNPDDGTDGEADDYPNNPISYPFIAHSAMNDSFVTYLLYRPPGGDTQLVALVNWVWYAAGSATYNPNILAWEVANTGSGWEFCVDFPAQPQWTRRNVNP